MTTNETPAPAVALDGITKRFAKQTAVDQLSLRIPAGDAFGFLGQNGAGKTTTIKMLMGLLKPDAGTANVLGHDPVTDSLAIRQRVQNREWLLTVNDFTDDTVPRLRADNQLETVKVIDLGLEDIFKDYVKGWRTDANGMKLRAGVRKLFCE